MKKIIIKCNRKNVVWNFLDSNDGYKERIQGILEEIKSEVDRYYKMTIYRPRGQQVFSYWKESLNKRNMGSSFYDTGFLVLEERDRGEEEVVGVGTHVFVKTLDMFCLVDKVELDLKGNVIYYINYTKILNEKESNNLSVALEEWMSVLYPDVYEFEEMKKYEGVRHKPFEEYEEMRAKYDEATEYKSIEEQKKAIINDNIVVSNGKTYSDVLREREAQKENDLLAIFVGGVFLILISILLIIGFSS